MRTDNLAMGWPVLKRAQKLSSLQMTCAKMRTDSLAVGKSALKCTKTAPLQKTCHWLTCARMRTDSLAIGKSALKCTELSHCKRPVLKMRKNSPAVGKSALKCAELPHCKRPALKSAQTAPGQAESPAAAHFLVSRRTQARERQKGLRHASLYLPEKAKRGGTLKKSARMASSAASYN